MSTIVISFGCFLIAFVAIGAASAFRSRGTNDDYLVAGQSMQPWLVALSAVSTGCSGYMFIGQIGYTYTVGLSSIWLMFGWIVGDFCASLLIFRKLRVVSGTRSMLSFGGLLSRWQGTEFSRLRLLVGIVTIVFLGTYAAAQLKAGSKALHVLFGWDESVGAIIGFVIVVVYCLAGGIRASIWTDAAQSMVMVVAMGLLLWVCVDDAGGVSAFSTQLHAVSDTFMYWFPTDLPFAGSTFGYASAAVLFVVGWLFTGFGVAGQPHVVIRYMTLDSADNLGRLRVYYYVWYVIFYACAIGVGLAARVLLPVDAAFDAELAMPTLAQNHLTPVLVGVVLAGLFSATMSTADSQILSCSAALTRDVLPKQYDTIWVTKVGTVTVALGALVISLFAGSNVFDLVIISWAVLGAAFTPLIVVYVMGYRVSEATAVLMVIGGVAVTILWREFGLSQYIYEIAPGILSGLLVRFVAARTPLEADGRAV